VHSHLFEGLCGRGARRLGASGCRRRRGRVVGNRLTVEEGEVEEEGLGGEVLVDVDGNFKHDGVVQIHCFVSEADVAGGGGVAASVARDARCLARRVES
jgi:hypothetical protein